MTVILVSLILVVFFVSASVSFMSCPMFSSSCQQRKNEIRIGPLFVKEHPAGNFKELLGKHDSFPHTMFRILNTKTPRFRAREMAAQAALGSTSFDFVSVDGKICPLENNLFTKPNGMSVRPNTMNEFNLISEKSDNTFICEIPKGTPVPDGTVLVHEFEDHFSLQPARCMEPKEFDILLTSFLSQLEVLKKREWMLKYPFGTQIAM